MREKEDFEMISLMLGETFRYTDVSGDEKAMV